MTDEECLRQLRRNGKARAEAISHLYRSYARKFLAYFVKHRVPRQNAEELVQDVFVNVVRHSGDFRGETRFDAWMWAIVRNTLINHFRRERPEEQVDEDTLELLVNARADPPPTAGMGLEECVRRAYALFAEVYADRAEILARIAFDGWSTEDVAAALRRTPGATREYLSQSRKKLKAFLEPCREFLTG
jgi:RNA polymerase sigma-70 factor (ECF subfamily)